MGILFLLKMNTKDQNLDLNKNLDNNPRQSNDPVLEEVKTPHSLKQMVQISQGSACLAFYIIQMIIFIVLTFYLFWNVSSNGENGAQVTLWIEAFLTLIILLDIIATAVMNGRDVWHVHWFTLDLVLFTLLAIGLIYMSAISFSTFERRCMLGLLCLRLALQIIRFIVVLFEAIDMVKKHHTALGEKGNVLNALQHGYGTFHDQKVDNDVMNLAIGISKTIKKQNDQYEEENHNLMKNSLFNLITKNTKYNTNQLLNISANHQNNQYNEYQKEENKKLCNNMASNMAN